MLGHPGRSLANFCRSAIHRLPDALPPTETNGSFPIQRMQNPNPLHSMVALLSNDGSQYGVAGNADEVRAYHRSWWSKAVCRSDRLAAFCTRLTLPKCRYRLHAAHSPTLRSVGTVQSVGHWGSGLPPRKPHCLVRRHEEHTMKSSKARPCDIFQTRRWRYPWGRFC